MARSTGASSVRALARSRVFVDVSPVRGGDVNGLFGRIAILLVGFGVPAVPNLAHPVEKVAVFDFSSVGVEEATVATVSGLLRAELRAAGRFTVTDRSEMVRVLGENLVCPGGGEAMEMGEDLGVDKAVIGKVNRLGEKIIVSVSLIDVNTGKVEYSDRLTSLTVEDLDAVIERLAKGLATGRPADKTVEVETVTEKEAVELRKRLSAITTGVKMGLAQPLAGFEGVSDTKVALQSFVWYETPGVAAELALGGAWIDLGTVGEDLSFSDTWVEISLFRFLSQRDFSPFLGGGMGLHLMTAGESAATGFGINLSAGVVTFRTYDLRLMGGIRYHLILGQMEEDDLHHMISLDIGLSHARREFKPGCPGCVWPGL